MSTPSSIQSIIHVTAVTVSAESAKKTKRLTSGELRIGTREYKLICDKDGTLRQEFPNLTELSPEVQVTLSNLKTPSWFSKTKTETIDTQQLFSSSVGTPTQDLSVAQNGIRVTFSCRATQTTSIVQTAEPLTPTTSESLTPTTQAILKDCPRFRILVIGKSGVGKSSLINSAFGISEACSSSLKRGVANIEKELASPSNNKFILHDSLGFEPGDNAHYDTVKEFIRKRQSVALKDQLHAVWFCIQIPRAGGRLLEVAAEDFFRENKKTLGNIPLIVVYTMFDSSVDEWTMQLAPSNGGLDDKSLTELARSEAKSSVDKRHNEITQLAGKSLPYAVVSTTKNYEYTLQSLVELTHHRVGIRGTPEAQITSVVTLMAQRAVPHLKIQGSINVGKQRYWKALRASPVFNGHAIWDCLSVIHADIIAVWNFNDPACHLLDKKFKGLVVKMVQQIDTLPTPNISKIFALGGGAAGAAHALLGFVSSPAAPIVLPVVAGVMVATWLYDVYQNVKNVQRIFIAFIADLTYIMETLFILTAGGRNKLTRRAIKLAYKTYYDSGIVNQVHNDIQTYHDLPGRDSALEMIESLIKPERSGDLNIRNYCADVGKLDVQKLELDREEEWE